MLENIPNNIIRKMALVAIFLSLSIWANSQYFIADQSIEVLDQSAQLKSRAFCGGMRSPMFSELDADNDGIMDLFVFDRHDYSVSIFLYKNGEYHYAPDYDYYFPPMTGWVLLRDFNCDGKNDIFTGTFSGVQVWENTTVAGGELQFSLTTTSLNSTDGPVSVVTGDIPAIDDIDGDGDLDILTFGPSATYVTYYRNNSATNCDLDLSIYTNCWGHFAEAGQNSDIILNDSCGGDKPSPLPNDSDKKVVHQGSTLATIDYDGDGDKDLVVGDISSNKLKLLINSGNSQNAVIGQVIDGFPSTFPIDIYIYPAAYFIDVDHDGDKDLVSSTAEISQSGGSNFDNTWYYENKTDNAATNFQFTQVDFLTDKAIEVGAGAIPHFYDYDHDGDQDLLISSFSEKTDPFNVRSHLSLYQNIGDSSKAKFQLVDDNFAGFGDTVIYGLNPTTGDLDNDGDIDLLLGTSDGFWIYLENMATPGSFPSFNAPIYHYGGFDLGFGSAPFLIDFDRDGDFDILEGMGNGNINYYENVGNANTPSFNLVTDSLGKVNVQNSQFPTGYGFATPYITYLDSNSIYDLVVGSWDGVVHVYLNIENYSINDKYPSLTETYYDSIALNYTELTFARRSAPALADLDYDGLNDMIIGVFKGGVYYVKNNSDTVLIPDTTKSLSTQVSSQLRIYPNPTRDLINIEVKEGGDLLEIRLFNAIGEKLNVPMQKINYQKFQLLMNDLPRGVYLISISTPSAVYSKKIIKK